MARQGVTFDTEEKLARGEGTPKFVAPPVAPAGISALCPPHPPLCQLTKQSMTGVNSIVNPILMNLPASKSSSQKRLAVCRKGLTGRNMSV
jgi:hypothetical protein